MKINVSDSESSDKEIRSARDISDSISACPCPISQREGTTCLDPTIALHKVTEGLGHQCQMLT